MSPAPFIRCIYCGQDRLASREHVLQRAMGGNLTARFVCEDCNTSFSAIDQSLAERSLESLPRVAAAPKGGRTVKLGGELFRYEESTGNWQEIEIRDGMTAVVLPQLHLRGRGVQFFASDAAGMADFVRAVDERVALGTLLDTRIRVGPGEYATTPRLVKHRKKDMFVRASSTEAAIVFLKNLLANWRDLRGTLTPANKSEMHVEIPNVHVRQAIVFDDVLRAIAKSTFNLLAYRRGAEFALRSDFDGVRYYIQGKSIEHPRSLGEDDIAVDFRYVRPGFGERLVPYLVSDHFIALMYIHPTLHGIARFYGSIPYYVRLGDVPNYPETLYVHEFSTDRTANRELTMLELARRFREGVGETFRSEE